MTTRFVLTFEARAAINEIWDYYLREGGTQLADRILADVYDAIVRLAEHPTLGHLRPDLTQYPLRFYRVHRFLIVYKPDSKPLQIARIYHSARDIRRLLGRNPVT
jgi:plasmid stabilization system protein ParE